MKAVFDRARAALAFLESHQIAPTPAHYDLALRYLADPTGPLGRQIAAYTDGGLRLTGEQAALLIASFADDGTPASIGAREQAVSEQTAQLSSLTSGAHELTSALGRDVGAFAADQASWPDSATVFSDRLGQAERELADMRSEISALRSRIAAPATDAGRGGASDRLADPVIDTLTDALTRRGAEAVLAQLAHYDRGFALILVQLDGLVAINERYGQSVGNNVLSALVSTLRQHFPDQELIRWSGNEFVIVILDTAVTVVRTQLREALDALAKRRLRLRDSGEYIGTVTASAALLTARGESGEDVLARARARLADTAGLGGNRLET
ncbi:diguanylate cyclase domain-containing protein [Sphingomonas floccifaciens]|uniref:Diguanylate cyclase domain-containing protein n=1 Tax=Sphingomonas floccifaciens TaxID=1844115 RepID=A0ABW4N974_9SPHN